MVGSRSMLTDGTRVERAQAIDSHTGGEPTRLVIAGGPDLDHVNSEATLIPGPRDLFSVGIRR